MKRQIISIFLILVGIILNGASSQAEKFVISKEHVSNFAGISEFLGLYPVAPMPSVPFYLRSPLPNKFGNYFYSPRGAQRDSLTISEKTEIKELLYSFIDSSLYDSYIIDNLQGYYYELFPNDTRREYHIRYAQGDTIYVISGLMGKFLSFYRAVPATGQPNINNLQEEVKKISPTYNIVSENLFKVKTKDSLYFIEYVDKDKLLRIRAYNFSEIISLDEKGQPSKEAYYDLIEVTKFLIKDVIP